jgi:hypothetical protein
MVTVSVKVQDDLVKLCGIEALKKILEEELEYQRFRLLENKIQKALADAAVDWEKEFETSREEAFEEYQRRRAGN